METKRTPWSIKITAATVIIKDALGATVAYLPLTNKEDPKKTAESIVNACNAHDEMVAAVEECLKAERCRRAKLLPRAPATDYCEKRIARLKAAVAKARGEAVAVLTPEIHFAVDNYLDSLMMNPETNYREWYTGDRNNQPNDHCVWDEVSPPHGWRETDEHFRARIKAALSASVPTMSDYKLGARAYAESIGSMAQCILGEVDDLRNLIASFPTPVIPLTEDEAVTWNTGFPVIGGMYFVELADGEVCVTPWNDGSGKNRDSWGDKREKGWYCLTHSRSTVKRWVKVSELKRALVAAQGDK